MLVEIILCINIGIGNYALLWRRTPVSNTSINNGIFISWRRLFSPILWLSLCILKIVHFLVCWSRSARRWVVWSFMVGIWKQRRGPSISTEDSYSCQSSGNTVFKVIPPHIGWISKEPLLDVERYSPCFHLHLNSEEDTDGKQAG